MSTAQVAIVPKLLPVFEGPADIRGAYGGRGSGKTQSFAKMIAVRGLVFGSAGVSGQLVCGRQFMNSLDDSSLEECKRAIESEPFLAEYYEVGATFIKSRDGRIWFTFVGLDRSLASIKSKGRVLIVWVDEARPVTARAWSIVGPTLREEGSDWNAELWITWNPELETDAVEDFRRSTDPLVKMAEINYRDNPRFPARMERERLRDLASKPKSEYENIWEGKLLPAVRGAIYFDEVADAEAKGRVGRFPRDPMLKVHRIWDMGWNDAMAIILAQRTASAITAIGFVTGTRRTVDSYLADFQGSDFRGWNWGKDFLPHDGFAKSRQTGKTDADILRGLGCKVLPTPNMEVEQGIRTARALFPRMYFDRDGCASRDPELPGLIECLKRYRRRVNQQTDTPEGPLHDVHSNGADAYRYLALVADEMTNEEERDPVVTPLPMLSPFARRQ